eukprot:gene13891-18628_t
MSIRKRKIKFIAGFEEPTDEEIVDACGPFPFENNLQQILPFNCFIADLNEESYYKCDRNLFEPLPSVKYETDWLVNVSEPRESFLDYTRHFLSRSGRINPRTTYQRILLYILPILKENDEWPSYAPRLDVLSSWISAFFQREVIVLPAIKFSINFKDNEHFCSFHIKNELINVPIRFDIDTGHYQLHMNTILDLLKKFFEINTDALGVMGITCEDLYSDQDNQDNLFTAGLATCYPSGEHVGILSFLRYHPSIKMSSADWYDYKFAKKNKSKLKKRTMHALFPSSCNVILEPNKLEYLRRAGKLIIHEFCHLLCFHHCVYNHCLMNGTGNLREDFNSPTYLCGICLRKLQFRLGFDVIQRYKSLGDVYRSVGLEKDFVWVERRLKDVLENKKP